MATLHPFINEIHYDNVGTDTGEFVEIAGVAGTDLTDYSLVLYNGANGLQYGSTLNLLGTIDNEGSGFGAVSFSFPVNGLQNGAPDGLALTNTAGSTIYQFLSYEGSFAAVDGFAIGLTSTDIGVSETASTPIGTSLQLVGTGMNSGDFSWVSGVAETPGFLNANQTLIDAAVPLPASLPFLLIAVVALKAGARRRSAN